MDIKRLPAIIMKWLGRIVLSVIGLIILLVVAVYLPPVQQWLKNWATDYLSEETGMKIEIEWVRLSPWLDLTVEQMSAVDKGDTVVAARELMLDVKVLPLLKGQVDLNCFELRNAQLNTKDFISDTHVEGHFRLLKMDIPAVCDLEQKHVDVNRIRLKDADMTIVLSDTAAADTTPSEPTEWQLALGELKIENSRLALETKSWKADAWQEQMHLKADINNLSAKQANINLKEEEYRVGELALLAKDVGYDVPYEKAAKGLDTNHLFFPTLTIDANNISYTKQGVDLGLQHLALKEKSGLEVSNISGTLHYDSTLVKLSNGHLETPHTKIDADVSVGENNHMEVKVKGDIGKQDVMLLAGDALGDIGKQWPDKPANLNLRAEGTMDNLAIDYCHLTLPGNMEMRLSGRLNEIGSDLRRNGKMHYTIALKDAGFISKLLPKDIRQQLRIPNGTRIGGDIDFRGNQFNLSRNTIYCGNGSLSFSGRFSASNMTYDGKLTARQFPLQRFLPNMGLSPLTGEFDVKGKGTDFLNPNTTLKMDSKIGSFSYAGLPLNNMHINANLNGSNAEGFLRANNSWLKAALNFTANRQDGRISGSIDGRIDNLKLSQFMEMPDTTTGKDMRLMADINLRGFYEDKEQKIGIGGTIDNLNAVDSRMGYPGGAIHFGLGTSPDSTHIYLNSGDMTLMARAEEPLERLISSLSNFSSQFVDSLSVARLEHNALKRLLPDMKMRLKAGNNNPLQQMLAMAGYGFDTLSARLTTNPTDGLNATANISGFRTGAIMLEHSELVIRQDSDALQLHALVENTSKKNPNRFRALVDGNLLGDGFRLMANFKDDKGREGINIGTHATLDGKGGISLKLIPEVSTLAYRHFKINPDNFLSIDPAGFISANIDLLADDNTNLKVFSINNDSINQDITLSIANLNLRDLSNVVPFMPKVSGWLDGDIHVIKTEENMTAVGQLQSRKLEYEGIYMGDLGTELFYMPENDGHYVVAQILSQEKEVAVLDGHYYDKQNGVLDATLTLDQFPTELLNTFLSEDGTIAVRGIANGEISVKGPTDMLALNGQLNPDSIHVYSELYGFDLAMENKAISIDNGKILFDQMKFFGRQSENPLIIDGSVDWGYLSDIIFDLSIKAKDFALINAEKTKKSLVYGKVFVDMDATLKGKSGFMMLRGDLNVLGNTDVTYIMRDTPLQVDDQFSGMVEFVDFSDDEPTEEQPEEEGGVFVNLNLNVDEATHLHCDLSDDGKSYVDCNGGGDLKMMMFPSGDMSMTGRFNIKGGEMKYTLPFIPLKTFTFAEGNYILFNGDIDNPTLNITATERTKAAVTSDNDMSRMVVFDVGVKISKQLSNMGIEFLIDAPEDAEVQTELATMGPEMKNKIAITMLATGLYMSSNNKTGFKANNALNSFLESQIQEIAGSALKTIDISVGVEGNTTSTGETQTDYTFQFSKKFWNDRVTFIIGGKVTTGAEDNTSSSQSFIDNISLEYRLDRFGTRYIQVFYDNDTHDPLEGSYSSAGAGYIWRSKTDRFGDLLLFRNKRSKTKKEVKK